MRIFLFLKKILWLVLCMIPFLGFGQEVFFNEKSNIILHKQGKNSRIAHFVALHQDETTAVAAFYQFQQNNWFKDLRFFQLLQKSDRLIYFYNTKKQFAVDPNRMFSIAGIQASLKIHNKKKMIPTDLVDEIHSFADSLLHHILPKDSTVYIVALHNNTNKNYSILSYKNSNDVDTIHLSSIDDPDDFYLVTERSDFNFFVGRNRNVALQSKQAFDDGSLSIYCQQRNIPYINIEAEHGHLQQQELMIKEVYTYLFMKKCINNLILHNKNQTPKSEE